MSRACRDDCYYFYNGSCIRGDRCQFRHCEAARVNTEVCTLWREGRCFRQICCYRHSEDTMKRNRSNIACYWENQTTGCRRPQCAFLHLKPRDDSGTILSEEDMLANVTSPPPEMVMPMASDAEAVAMMYLTSPAPPLGLLQEGAGMIGSPQVPQVVINPFDDESDGDSVHGGTPVKTDIRQRLQDVKMPQSLTSSNLRYIQTTDMEATPSASKPPCRVKSDPDLKKVNLNTSNDDSSNLNFGVKSLEEIRQEKLARAKRLLEEANDLLVQQKQEEANTAVSSSAADVTPADVSSATSKVVKKPVKTVSKSNKPIKTVLKLNKQAALQMREALRSTSQRVTLRPIQSTKQLSKSQSENDLGKAKSTTSAVTSDVQPRKRTSDAATTSSSNGAEQGGVREEKATAKKLIKVRRKSDDQTDDNDVGVKSLEEIWREKALASLRRAQEKKRLEQEAEAEKAKRRDRREERPRERRERSRERRERSRERSEERRERSRERSEERRERSSERDSGSSRNIATTSDTRDVHHAGRRIVMNQDDKLVGNKQRTTIKSRLGQPHDMNKSAPSRQTEVKTSVKQRLGFSKKLVNDVHAKAKPSDDGSRRTGIKSRLGVVSSTSQQAPASDTDDTTSSPSSDICDHEDEVDVDRVASDVSPRSINDANMLEIGVSDGEQMFEDVVDDDVISINVKSRQRRPLRNVVDKSDEEDNDDVRAFSSSVTSSKRTVVNQLDVASVVAGRRKRRQSVRKQEKREKPVLTSDDDDVDVVETSKRRIVNAGDVIEVDSPVRKILKSDDTKKSSKRRVMVETVDSGKNDDVTTSAREAAVKRKGATIISPITFGPPKRRLGVKKEVQPAVTSEASDVRRTLRIGRVVVAKRPSDQPSNDSSGSSDEDAAGSRQRRSDTSDSDGSASPVPAAAKRVTSVIKATGGATSAAREPPRVQMTKRAPRMQLYRPPAAKKHMTSDVTSRSSSPLVPEINDDASAPESSKKTSISLARLSVKKNVTGAATASKDWSGVKTFSEILRDKQLRKQQQQQPKQVVDATAAAADDATSTNAHPVKKSGKIRLVARRSASPVDAPSPNSDVVLERDVVNEDVAVVTSHKVLVNDRTVSAAAVADGRGGGIRRIRRNVWSTRDEAASSSTSTSQPRITSTVAAPTTSSRKLNIARRQEAAAADDDDDTFAASTIELNSSPKSKKLFGKDGGGVSQVRSQQLGLFGKKLTADSQRPTFGKVTNNTDSSRVAANAAPITGPAAVSGLREAKPSIGRSPLLRKQPAANQTLAANITPISVRTSSALQTAAPSSSRLDDIDGDVEPEARALEIPVTPISIKTTQRAKKVSPVTSEVASTKPLPINTASASSVKQAPTTSLSRVASSPPAARSSQATVTSSSSDSVYRQSIDDLDNELLALAAGEGDVIDINDVSASDAPGNDTLLLDLEELIS